MPKEKCHHCNKKAVFNSLCNDHNKEFEEWKRTLSFRYGDTPNEWALLTSFNLEKILKKRKKEKIKFA